MKKFYTLFTFLLAISALSLAQAPSVITYGTSNSAIGSNTVKDIYIDSENNKWFATTSGLSTLSNSTWTKLPVSAPGTVMAAAPSGKIWAAAGKSIIIFDPAGGSAPVQHNNVSKYKISALAFDRNGNLWAATQGGGVIMNPHSSAVVYSTRNSGIPSDIITSIEIDSKNAVWVGTELAGLASFDGTSWKTYNAGNSSLPDNNITSIAVDGNNNKWIGTGNGGLVKFNGKNFTVYDKSNSRIPGMTVSAVEVDKSNRVWVGTRNGEAASFNGSAWTIYDIASAGLSDNEVLAIAFDQVNGVWFGTAARGALWFCTGPSAVITTSKLSACNSIKLSANKGNYTYQWLMNGNRIAGATSSTYNATGSGEYSVIVSDASACPSASKPVNVKINPLPSAPTITQSAGVLASSAANGNQWYLNGNPIAGATEQFYKPVQEGFYTVSVINANGCASVSAPVSYRFTATEEKRNEPLNTKVYPNPTEGMFTVQISNSDVKITSLSITDILGNMVWRENVADQNNSEINVDVTGMIPGVYFLSINTTERTFTRKLSIK